MDHILNSKLWVIIDLESNEDEQKIFDSINTAGLKLTATDIIKNAIFDRAIKLEVDYNKWYNTYWESIFEKNEECRNFWEQEVTTGRIHRVQSEIFLHAFAIIDGFFNPNDTLENLSAIYKNKIQDFDANKLELFLQKIYEYAIIYQELPQITKQTPLSYEDYESRFFSILKTTNTISIIPLILYLKKELKNDEKTLKESLYLLEVFVVTRWLYKKDNKSYNKFFPQIIRSLQKTNKNNTTMLQTLRKSLQGEEIPTIEDIEDLLGFKKKYYLDERRAKLVLFWIELSRQNSDEQDITKLSYEYTLEHLMPQSWKEHWSKVGESDENAKKLIYQIGNMTLLKGALNDTIQNQSWKIKLNGDGSRKNHIRNYADLLITRELLNEQEWNKCTIRERTGRLIKEFFKV